MNFRLMKSRVYRLSGKVVSASTRNVQITLESQNRAEAATGLARANLTTAPDGTFNIAAVRPGSYYLVALRAEGTGPKFLGRLAVEVTNSNIDGLMVSSGSGVEITGSLRVAGDNPSVQGAALMLLPAEGMSFQQPVAVRPDGTFRLDDVPPDHYRLNFFGLPGDAWVKSIRVGEQEAAEKGIDLTQVGSKVVLDIALSMGAGVVEGSVQVDQRPVSAAVVMLLPEPVRPEQPYLSKTVRTDRNGRFRITGVAPGDYRVYACEEGIAPTLDLNDPEFAKAVNSKAVKVSMRESGHEQIELTLLKDADANL
jgi:hypothetical protein